MLHVDVEAVPLMRRRRGPGLSDSADFGSTSPGFSRESIFQTGEPTEVVMQIGVTSVRDRTAEFAAIVESARKAPTRPGSSVPAVNLRFPGTTSVEKRSSRAHRSDFTRLAAQVSADIAQTSVKLAQLTTLAQRRSLFDDPTAEIQELTFVIKQDISALNGRLEDLQHLRDATRRSSNKQAGVHSENVVDSLKSRLGATAEGFKSVLQMRSDSLAAQQDRRSQFLGASASAPLSLASSGPEARSVALDLGGGSLGASGSSVSLGSTSNVQSQMLIRPPQDLSYHHARADAVRQVESTIVELGQIFNQLATMVSEQGELVERIDANVDETVINMDAGHNQLITYYNSISGNRGLILKVFGVLLMFLILWVVIL